jgi:hypothetical protein
MIPSSTQKTTIAMIPSLIASFFFIVSMLTMSPMQSDPKQLLPIFKQVIFSQQQFVLLLIAP